MFTFVHGLIESSNVFESAQVTKQTEITQYSMLRCSIIPTPSIEKNKRWSEDDCNAIVAHSNLQWITTGRVET